MLHATPPNLYYGSGPPIRCIEWPRRRAIATDFNVSDSASAATVSYTAQCRTGHLFKGNIDSQQVFLNFTYCDSCRRPISSLLLYRICFTMCLTLQYTCSKRGGSRPFWVSTNVEPSAAAHNAMLHRSRDMCLIQYCTETPAFYKLLLRFRRVQAAQL